MEMTNGVVLPDVTDALWQGHGQKCTASIAFVTCWVEKPPQATCLDSSTQRDTDPQPSLAPHDNDGGVFAAENATD